ncbi:MAG: hypothetical protein ACFB0D_16940 [Phormidesmis sp.]
MTLHNGRYQESSYRGDRIIQSETFPDFSVTAEKLLSEDDV